MWLPASFDPLVRIDFGKRDLAGGILIDFGYLEAGEPSPSGSVDLTSASDEDRLRIQQQGLVESLVNRSHSAYALAAPHPVTRDHERRPARQRPAYGVVCLATHDQHVARRQGLESLPVRRNPPRYVVPRADDAVGDDSGDPDDLRHQTAIGALMPGCGSYPSIVMSFRVKSSIELTSGFSSSFGRGRGIRFSWSLA